MGRKAQKAKNAKKQAWENSDEDEEHEETNESSSESEQEEDQQSKNKGGANKKDKSKTEQKSKAVVATASASASKAPEQQQQQSQQTSSNNDAAAASTSTTTETTTTSSSSSRKPVQVIYCPISGWPAEMCEYNGQFVKCKQWHIDHAEELKIDVDEVGGEKGRKQKQPGDEVLLGNPNKKNTVKELTIDIRKRTGRKKTTLIKGLEYWGIQPNPVAQLLKKRFSCGTAVIDPPSSGMPATVEVQGDNTQHLIQLLTGKDYNIPQESIVLLREGKPLRAKTGDQQQDASSSSSDDEDDDAAAASLPPPQPKPTDEELLAHNNRDAPAPRPKGKKPVGKKK